MTKYNQLTTREVVNIQNNSNTKIIDSRSVDAYNGWNLQNEARGGHITGAKSLPYKWVNYIDWIEIVHKKKILKKNTIVIYGYKTKQIQKVAQRFINAGYTNVYIYNDFLNEWTNNHDLSMNHLENYQHLVHAHWVKDVVDGKSLSEHKVNNIIICHAHYRNREAYLSGHIPGAIDLDTLALEAPETWNRRSPEQLKKALEQHGITADSTVILYGKFMQPDNDDDFPGSAAGHIGAIRCAFIMMYAGVKDVRVLNGGFQSWKDAGFEVSTKDVLIKPTDEFGITIPLKPELAVDIPQAKKMIKAMNSDLVCVRSYPEFIGEVSGYNYIKKKGRIPGAVFADCGTDAYHMENYRNVDHTTREFQEISEIWKKSNITPEKHLAFYCGTGWRGSEAWFNAWLMGWPKVSVFDGGWFEWSNNPENPFETGIPTS